MNPRNELPYIQPIEIGPDDTQVLCVQIGDMLLFIEISHQSISFNYTETTTTASETSESNK